jgi:PAS domain S-box-containing protein
MKTRHASVLHKGLPDRQRPEHLVTPRAANHEVGERVFEFLAHALGTVSPKTSHGRRYAAGVSLALGIVFVFVLGWLDRSTPPGLNLQGLYLLGCAFVGWRAGGRAAFVIAFISAALIWLEQITSGASGVNGIGLLNQAMRLAAFGAIGWIAGAAGKQARHLRLAVQRRTATLQREVETHKETSTKWREMAQLFRQLTENITEVFWVSDPARSRFIYLNPGFEKVWGRECKAAYLDPAEWLEGIHYDDRGRVMEAIRTAASSGGYNQEYRVLRPDGTIRWVHDRAFPVLDSNGSLYRFAGIAEDVTERMEQEQLKSRLERQILEISDREQARLGENMHDGLCQQLVGAAFVANSLAQELEAGGNAYVSKAMRVGQLLDEAITESRQVARGLYPVRLGSEGLGPALNELARTTSSLFGVQCVCDTGDIELQCPLSTAMHLYRIAQEALTNAAKHSQPTIISVGLTVVDGVIRLSVDDNGKGFQLNGASEPGMGLHMMRYRAKSIGAELRITSCASGTHISCNVPLQVSLRRSVDLHPA